MYNPDEYWEKRFANSFNLEVVGFDSFGKSFNRWQYQMKNKILSEFVNSLNLDGKSVLEIGCGTGFYIDFWKKRGVKHLTGVDIVSRSVKTLAKRYPGYRFYKADISSDATLAKYDIITAFDVLFHIVDDSKFDRAIWNISRMCSDNGIVLITDCFPHIEPYVLNHQKSRTLDYYEKVLMRSGLIITDKLPVHFLLNAPLDVANRKFALFMWKIIGGLQLATRLMGLILYAMDTVLLKIVKESPSTEMLVCRKR